MPSSISPGMRRSMAMPSVAMAFCWAKLSLTRLSKLGSDGWNAVICDLRRRGGQRSLPQARLFQQRQHARDEERQFVFEIDERQRDAVDACGVQPHQFRHDGLRAADQR